jgi:hypothetical protein
VEFMLRMFLRQSGTDPKKLAIRKWTESGVEWAGTEFEEEGPEGDLLRWLVWLATNHDLILFLSYVRRADEGEPERPEVEAIVRSLEFF